MQPDGKILVSGYFSTLGGGGTGTTTRNRVGRLNADGSEAAIQNLAVNSTGTVVTWSRSGTGPEVRRVTFESSTDGATYTSLGNGTRIAGGWELTGLNLPAGRNVFIRARAYSSTGRNGSESGLESIRKVYRPLLPFTDDPLTAAFTAVKAVHISELRSRIDTLRQSYGLTAYSYTDPTITPGTTVVLAQHIIDLRAALAEAYTAAGLTPPTYTDPALGPGTVIKVAHIAELRAAITAIA